MFRETFKQMLRTWCYSGISDVTLEFHPPYGDMMEAIFIERVGRLLDTGDFAEAEGYVAVVLKRAYIEGVGQYTLDGR